MTVAEQVRADITTTMKAGERDRVGALRLVLSELQKAAKDGGDDELTVLRRERKRRFEAATQFRDGRGLICRAGRVRNETSDTDSSIVPQDDLATHEALSDAAALAGA